MISLRDRCWRLRHHRHSTSSASTSPTTAPSTPPTTHSGINEIKLCKYWGHQTKRTRLPAWAQHPNRPEQRREHKAKANVVSQTNYWNTPDSWPKTHPENNSRSSEKKREEKTRWQILITDTTKWDWIFLVSTTQAQDNATAAILHLHGNLKTKNKHLSPTSIATYDEKLGQVSAPSERRNKFAKATTFSGLPTYTTVVFSCLAW